MNLQNKVKEIYDKELNKALRRFEAVVKACHRLVSNNEMDPHLAKTIIWIKGLEVKTNFLWVT